MTDRRFGFLLSLALLAVGSIAGAQEINCDDRAFRAHAACRQIILRYGPGFDREALAANHHLRWIGAIAALGQAWFEAPAGVDLQGLVQRIKSWDHGRPAPGVLDAETNHAFILPECQQLNVSLLDFVADPLAALRTQPALAAIRALPAAPPRSADVTVAVLDTGIDRGHPALADAWIEPGIDVVSGGLADDRGNGVDDSDPPDGRVDSGWGHGTAVAGLVHLVAPEARLLPVRVLDDECQGTAYTFAAGIAAAVDAGADVINVSLGAVATSPVVQRAVRYASGRGILIVAPSGNLAPGERNPNRMRFPASEHRDVAGVAAVDPDLVAPSWTVTHPHVALAAPGAGLLVPYRLGYAQVQGTSFAAALVSGAAAVALGREPGLDRVALLARLQETAIGIDVRNPALRGKLGAGMPDVRTLAGLPAD